jgi:mannose-6-phosphate isomerase-like protein (cupin superfamily)
MATTIRTPETRGDDESTIGSGVSATDREIQAHRPADWETRPQLFRMFARIPTQGRASALMGATDRMWVALKTYAEGGENKLHNHTNEDHTFIVMEGAARFHGPDGESVVLGRHQGILLPRGCYYCFNVEGDEPLVLMRIGCVVDAAKTPWGRTDEDGKTMLGNDRANNVVEKMF